MSVATPTAIYPARTWDDDLRAWTREPMRERSFYEAFGKAHGVDYVGSWDGYLQFQKEIIKPEMPMPGQPGSFYVRQVLYGVTACTDEDIDNGNAAWMIQHGHTRTGESPEED